MTPDTEAPIGIEPLAALLRDRRFVALVGAGCSTESGIPDYRGPGSRSTPVRPIMYQEFLRSPETRARYWARSAVGWRRVGEASPNPAHRALARLENEGALSGVITQNVDGLHHAAGSRRVVELHGSLAEVRCLGCERAESRAHTQDRLLELNPRWARHVGALDDPGRATPDGDASLPEDLTEGFVVPDCRVCGGVLKPDVVFFGENVPAAVVAEAWSLFEVARGVLVVGSSLTVYSGRRFVDRAAREGLPVAIVNVGPTRADEVATVRVEGRAGTVLPMLARSLAPTAETPTRPAR